MRALALIALTTASLAIAACDREGDISVPPENGVVVNDDQDIRNDADNECPRKDGTPCR